MASKPREKKQPELQREPGKPKPSKDPAFLRTVQRALQTKPKPAAKNHPKG